MKGSGSGKKKKGDETHVIAKGTVLLRGPGNWKGEVVTENTSVVSIQDINLKDHLEDLMRKKNFQVSNCF